MSVSPLEAVKVLSQKFILQEGIVGVGYSCSNLNVYVESPDLVHRVPSTLLGFRTRVIVTGRIYILQMTKTSRWRPVVGGVSVGHPLITAGTLGSRVFDARTGRRLFLSNNHVIAASNRGRPGDAIIQPGSYDGGTLNDRIGVLERFIELRPEPELNLVDAAVGRPDDDRLLSDEVLDIGVVTGPIMEASVGRRVAKSGRTTCYGEANIIDVNATVKVFGYPWGTSLFEDQIVTERMARPGDSGSLAVDRATKRPVGLVFAGSDVITVLNKMTHVARLLNITFTPPVGTPVPTNILMPLPILFGSVLAGMTKEKA